MTRRSLSHQEVEYLWPDVSPPARGRLLEAGLDLIHTHGYHGTTTRAIARAAGMSPAALYVHYRTKDDLLFDLTKAGHFWVLTSVRAAVDDCEPSPTTRIRRFVEVFVGWHAQHAALARIVQYEWANLAPARRRVLRRLRGEVEQLLHRELISGMELGDFAIDDLRSTELALLSLGIDVSRWYGMVRDIDVADLQEHYGRLALRLVGVGGGAAK